MSFERFNLPKSLLTLLVKEKKWQEMSELKFCVQTEISCQAESSETPFVILQHGESIALTTANQKVCYFRYHGGGRRIKMPTKEFISHLQKNNISFSGN